MGLRLTAASGTHLGKKCLSNTGRETFVGRQEGRQSPRCCRPCRQSSPGWPHGCDDHRRHLGFSTDYQPIHGLVSPTTAGIWHYARGIAFARTGRAGPAEAELVALREIARNPVLNEIAIWGINPVGRLMQIAVGSLSVLGTGDSTSKPPRRVCRS